MRCQEIMSKTVATVPLDAKVVDAARLMKDKDVGFLPIVDGSGKAVGTVTDRDIVVNCVAQGRDCNSARLSDFGGNQVVFCLPQDEVEQAQRLMEQNKIQRILVCDEQKRPVGVISLQDLAQAQDETEVGETVQQVKQGAPPSIH